MKSYSLKITNFAVAVLVLALNNNVFARTATDADYERWFATWDSLVPAGTYSFVPDEFADELWNDPLFKTQLDNASRALNTNLSNQLIELAGFMVPINFEGEKVFKFLLVPEAGQCIHVPPPPLNQTILVDMEGRFTDHRDLYQPVIVTGIVNVGENSFELADSGYTLTDVRVETLEY